MIRIYKLCGPALLSMSGRVLAEELPSFDDLDRDGDGYISKGDVSLVPGLKQHFAAFDLDGDGLLSRHEYAIYEGRLGPLGGGPL